MGSDPVPSSLGPFLLRSKRSASQDDNIPRPVHSGNFVIGTVLSSTQLKRVEKGEVDVCARPSGPLREVMGPKSSSARHGTRRGWAWRVGDRRTRFGKPLLLACLAGRSCLMKDNFPPQYMCSQMLPPTLSLVRSSVSSVSACPYARLPVRTFAQSYPTRALNLIVVCSLFATLLLPPFVPMPPPILAPEFAATASKTQ